MIILLQILSLLFLTSCSSTDYLKNNVFSTPTQEKCQLKKLIIPEEITTPKNDTNYDIPYTENDVNQKKQSVFPPVKYFV